MAVMVALFVQLGSSVERAGVFWSGVQDLKDGGL